jgi:hypothetical protein
MDYDAWLMKDLPEDYECTGEDCPGCEECQCDGNPMLCDCEDHVNERAEKAEYDYQQMMDERLERKAA